MKTIRANAHTEILAELEATRRKYSRGFFTDTRRLDSIKDSEEARRQEDQSHDTAHGADSHAAWAQLREADTWVDPA
jgi:hypothetical protein